MSILDIFAWIVLIVLVLCAVAIFVIMAMLPGMVAKSRSHPWAHAIEIGGWVTLIFGFVFWPLVMIWAYVDIPATQKKENAS